jgi:Domain of unknown function (DUF5666)
MTTPIDPIDAPAPAPATSPRGGPVAFRGKVRGPGIVRVGVVLAATLVLLVSAALTFGASPSPSGGTNATPQTPAPNGGAPGNGGPRLRDRGFGGPFGLRDRARFGFGDITVTAVDGSNLSLKTDDGWTRTITTTGSTKITRGGASIATSDIKVGDHVRFRETRNADGSFNITAVDVVVPSVLGKVTAKTADTITVQGLDGNTATIHVNGATKYRVPGKDNATLGDIEVGAIVGAQGQKRADGSIDATTVRAAPKPGRWFGGRNGQDGKPRTGPNATPTPTPSSGTTG